MLTMISLSREYWISLLFSRGTGRGVLGPMCLCLIMEETLFYIGSLIKNEWEIQFPIFHQHLLFGVFSFSVILWEHAVHLTIFVPIPLITEDKSLSIFLLDIHMHSGKMSIQIFVQFYLLFSPFLLSFIHFLYIENKSYFSDRLKILFHSLQFVFLFP